MRVHGDKDFAPIPCAPRHMPHALHETGPQEPFPCRRLPRFSDVLRCGFYSPFSSPGTEQLSDPRGACRGFSPFWTPLAWQKPPALKNNLMLRIKAAQTATSLLQLRRWVRGTKTKPLAAECIAYAKGAGLCLHCGCPKANAVQLALEINPIRNT